MSEIEPARLLVARSITRKRGENFEKILFQAETCLPTGFTLEEGFSELDRTVLRALKEAERSSNDSPVETRQSHSPPVQAAGNLIETITAADERQLACKGRVSHEDTLESSKLKARIQPFSCRP